MATNRSLNARKLAIIISVLVTMLPSASHAQLSASFYSSSCPQLPSIVRTAMTQAVNTDPRMGASILRMFFHDCFVDGCDASVLLDDSSTIQSEKNALPNMNSLRGFEVIDSIKTSVEAACAATVSCADILALAAHDGVVLLGGPSWTVGLGRRDSTTANPAAANTDLPSPFSNLTTLISKFSAKGLSAKDMTALSGAHTIGQARCILFRSRIYNDANINPAFASTRQATCPSAAGSGDNNLAPIDVQTSTRFDNKYFQNLLGQRGLFHSDQELFNGGSQDALTTLYSTLPLLFSVDFATAMVKMGNISPLTRSAGQIRLNCRVVNS